MGEGVKVLSESRMRENCMSGLMRGVWKRGNDAGTKGTES
jgi:hypothetical protein